MKETPEKVAVGASFGLAFLATSSAAQDGSASLQPVSEELLAEARDGETAVFTARKRGAAGVLASRGSTVVDVLHVVIMEVDRVRIDASDSVVASTPSAQIGVGALLTLSAAAVDASDDVLAGSLDDAWSSDDSAIAEIITSSATDTITVRGGAPGETTVRAVIGGKEGAVLVTVVDPSGGGDP